MKVKKEDLRREFLKAINGEDLIINCARRLGIRLDSFKRKLDCFLLDGNDSTRSDAEVFKAHFVRCVLECFDCSGGPSEILT